MELVVVLAVTIIIATSVTVLLVSTQKQSDKQSERNQMLSEVTTLEAVVEDFCNAFDTSDYSLTFAESGVSVDGQSYYLSFTNVDGNKLIYKDFEGENTKKLNYVIGVKFETSGSTDVVKCTVSYKSETLKEDGDYTFVINRRSV